MEHLTKDREAELIRQMHDEINASVRNIKKKYSEQYGIDTSVPDFRNIGKANYPFNADNIEYR